MTPLHFDLTCTSDHTGCAHFDWVLLSSLFWWQLFHTLGSLNRSFYQDSFARQSCLMVKFSLSSKSWMELERFLFLPLLSKVPIELFLKHLGLGRSSSTQACSHRHHSSPLEIDSRSLDCSPNLTQPSLVSKRFCLVLSKTCLSTWMSMSYQVCLHLAQTLFYSLPIMPHLHWPRSIISLSSFGPSVAWLFTFNYAMIQFSLALVEHSHLQSLQCLPESSEDS